MLGIEFDTADHAEEVQWACFERGLLVLECGKSSVRMSPALTVSEAEMTTALRIFGEAVDDVASRGGAIAREAALAGALHDGRGRRLTDGRRRDGDTARVSTSKVATMRDAIATLVRDGDTVAIEGFTHLICFAAGHEIIRQRKRDLTLARLTPDVIYDQMIAAGVARKLVFSWLGNPGVGGLGAIRRRIEGEIPDEPLEVEEYSHFGMVGRYTAGAMNLPFFPLRSYFETDLPVANPLIRPIASPYGDGTVYAVPPLRPDVTIVHAQRASAGGDTQVWGLLGLPEGGGLRRGAGHRRRRGARRRGRHPGRPEPDDHPGPHRRCRRRRAVGRAPLVRPGRLRPRQPVLPRLGPDHPRRGRHAGLAARVGLRPGRPGRLHGQAGRGPDRVAPAGQRAVRLRGLRGVPLMASVRYLVADVDRSVAFYRDQLGFELIEQMGAAFARVSRGDLSLWLSGPTSSAARPMRDGREPVPGGWNRFVIEVEDLAAAVARMTAAGVAFRSAVVIGPGGHQILADDPDGNPIELFEPRR